MLIRLFVLLCIIFLLNTSHLLAYPGKILNSFPAPGTVCTGMTFDGVNLWIADYKCDKIFKIDVKSGQTISDIPSPGFWPMGLAWDGKYLWNVDSEQAKIFQIDPHSGLILNVIDSPTKDPEGLTWDGNTLWVGDSRKKKIMKIDLSDGTAIKTFNAPAGAANGLTWDGTYLWCTDRKNDEIYMIDSNSGEVTLIIDSPGPYPRGLAWDGNHLWNVDYQQDMVYQLVRKDDELFTLKDKRVAKITFTHQVKIYGQGELRDLSIYFAIPWDMPQQKIFATSFSSNKYTVEKDKWHQPIAIFNYKDIPTESTLESIMEVNAEISKIRYYIFPDNCGTLTDIPKEIRNLYTSNASKYMIDDPYIQDLAHKIVGDERNPYWIARKIFDYVRIHLEYELEGGWNVAPAVLERGTGSCSEYTFSFIALCRAAGLPARYVGAIVVRGDDASLDDVFHRWPEIYLPRYGWIPIDPQGGDKEQSRDRALNIGNLSNRFLITTQGGGDSEYLGWYYNYNTAYTSDPQVKVVIETFAEWDPTGKE